ncbi:MAG: hypothetical protein GY811_09320 [Myxococcales bacterium]|nr:hypothetical protein [Myxococcales bacterium]
MALTNTSQLLQDSMTAILTTWMTKYDGASRPLYWLLRAQQVDVRGGDVPAVLAEISDEVVKANISTLIALSQEYWADVRYASLEPVTKLWGTIVNSLRVAAKSDRVTEAQQKVFNFSTASLLAFFQSAWDRMDVADELYHLFRAMPAPECQAMAALLNVHVDAVLNEAVMCRIVRLLDHEGPMSPEEIRDLAALSNTDLVYATFSGLRGSA